jgi:hypothetical protein
MFLEIPRHSIWPLQRPGVEGTIGCRFDRFPPKLRFTLGVSYHMIVPFVVSSPTCLPNRKAGIMDIGPSHLDPFSSRNSAAYAVAVVGVPATFQKPEATAC